MPLAGSSGGTAPGMPALTLNVNDTFCRMSGASLAQAAVAASGVPESGAMSQKLIFWFLGTQARGYQSVETSK